MGCCCCFPEPNLFFSHSATFINRLLGEHFGTFSQQKLSVLDSVARWICYISIFAHWQQWKFAQGDTKYAKVGSKLCKIIIKPSQNFQRRLNFYQSGEILPNLVTLVLDWLAFHNKLALSDPIFPTRNSWQIKATIYAVLTGWLLRTHNWCNDLQQQLSIRHLMDWPCGHIARLFVQYLGCH